MTKAPVLQTVDYDDGSSQDFYFRTHPGLIHNVPEGYSIYQLGEDPQLYGKIRDEAADGCPGIFLQDSVVWKAVDTWFTEQWQYYMYAANRGMLFNHVSNLMGTWKFMMNGTGIGDDGDPRRNFISDNPREEVIVSAPKDPRLDKYRMMIRNSYACKPYDTKYLQVWTQNGNVVPMMKSGKSYPRTIQDVVNGKVTIDDYAYPPEYFLFAWHVCNNLRNNKGSVNNTTISPFAHGLNYSWTPSPNEIYTFFPNVSVKSRILIERRFMNKVEGDTYPNPYRRQ